MRILFPWLAGAVDARRDTTLFVWFGLTVLRNRRERFLLGALVTGFGAIAFLHLLNPDAFIVRTNVARGQTALQERPFD